MDATLLAAAVNHSRLPFAAPSDVTGRTSSARLSSPAAVTVAVLVVFLLSPMILIGNSLVLFATYRFKRLRTPSNRLLMSLAASDLGVGMFAPVGMYLELGGAGDLACLFGYGVAVTLCSVSVLVMVAVAVDRFTSLARPLRYNNLITHSAVERYIAVFWAYAAMVGFTPMGFAIIDGLNYRSSDCSFGGLVAKPVQLFMFCAVYGPSAVVLLFCYGYVYFIARGHARAISEVRYSIQHSADGENVVGSRHGGGGGGGGSGGAARYGLALAITAGMFLILWLPFQLCMLLDVFFGTDILTAWASVYLALPILASSAFNPWVYGYRNAELRSAVRRVLDDLLAALGLAHRAPRRPSDPMGPSAAATAADPASFIHHVQRADRRPLKPDGGADFLLVPIARPESSAVASDAGVPDIVITEVVVATPSISAYAVAAGNNVNHCGGGGGNFRRLRLSRSMVESFAIARGSDVLIIKGGKGMRHGASVV